MKIDLKPELRIADSYDRVIMDLNGYTELFNIEDGLSGETIMTDMTRKELELFAHDIPVSKYIRICQMGRVKGRRTHFKNLKRMQDKHFKRMWKRMGTRSFYHQDYDVQQYSIEHSEQHLADFKRQKLIFVKYI